MMRRKRSVASEIAEEEDAAELSDDVTPKKSCTIHEGREAEGTGIRFSIAGAERLAVEVVDLATFSTPQHKKRWETMPDSAKMKAIISIVRLFIFAGASLLLALMSERHGATGGRGTAMPRKLLNEAAGVSNASTVVLAQSQNHLSQIFGLRIAFGKALEKDRVEKHPRVTKDKLYLYNGIREQTLQQLIMGRACNTVARRGFVWFVLCCIWSSRGRTIQLKQLINHLRKLDERFPEIVLERAGKMYQRPEVPELGLDMMGMLKLMEAQGYIYCNKLDGCDPHEFQYSFGTRFFLEVGREQIACTYFDATGVPIDQNILKEIELETGMDGQDER